MQELFEECKSGKMLCGTCKKAAAERIEIFLKEFQKEKKAAIEKLPDFGIKV